MKNSMIIHQESLSCKYLLDKNSSIGFSVSRKYGNAVARNQFKRRCRSAFHNLFIKKGINITMVVLPKKKNLSYREIYRSIVSIYEKVSS